MSRPSTISRFKRRSFGERGIADGGAQVGEQVEILAQAQEPGFGADGVGHLVPLGAADGAKDDGRRGLGLFHRRIGYRHAVLVDGGAADVVALDGKFAGVALGVEEGDDAFHLGHGFLADAVAGRRRSLWVAIADDPED